MTRFVDIHAHVIPGIDDGPPTLEDAVELVRVAAAAGTRTLAATPHLHSDFPDVEPEELAARLEAVRQAVAAGGIEIELVSGGEVALSWALDVSPERLALVSYAQRGTDILIETPRSGLIGIEFPLQQVRLGGYRVVLAHPERGIMAASDLGRLEALAHQGVLLQVNAESLLAENRHLRGFARRLCTEGLASVIASDGHRASGPRAIKVLAAGVAELRKLVGDERAEWMSSSVPAAVLAGERIPPAPPVVARRRLFGRSLG